MLRWIVGIVLIAHGIGHSMGMLAAWTTVPSGLTPGHWLLSNDVTMESALGKAFGVLWLVALIAFIGAGLGVIFQQEWWQSLAVVSAVLSLVAIVPWLNIMPIFSAIGAVVVDLAVLIVLLTPWGDQVAEQLR